MTQLPIINAFWVGPRLGNLHASCLQSFVRQGHRMVLHVYETPEDTPPGVELADASLLMSKDRIIAHKKTGSLALASDIFRMELQAAESGIYVDCDCFCVKPLDDGEHIFGWEDGDFINAAVLKIPANSPTLAAMRAIPEASGFVPPWLKLKRRLRYRIRAALGIPVPLQKMPWGTVGPSAFTYYAREHGILSKAMPMDVFYPLHYSQIGLLYDPDLDIDDLITKRSTVIHLWNEVLRRKNSRVVRGSPLESILQSLET